MKEQNPLVWMFLLLAIALIVSFAATFWVDQRSLSASKNVDRHESFTRSLEAAFSTLQEAETGQRGYLLSHDEAYLEPFEKAQKDIGRRFVELQQFVITGEIDRKLFERVKETANAKMAELRRTVDLAQSGHLEEAIRILREGSGEIKVRTFDENDNTFCVAFQDTGIGLSEAAIERLFIPSNKLKQAKCGSRAA